MIWTVECRSGNIQLIATLCWFTILGRFLMARRCSLCIYSMTGMKYAFSTVFLEWITQNAGVFLQGSQPKHMAFLSRGSLKVSEHARTEGESILNERFGHCNNGRQMQPGNRHGKFIHCFYCLSDAGKFLCVDIPPIIPLFIFVLFPLLLLPKHFIVIRINFCAMRNWWHASYSFI